MMKLFVVNSDAIIQNLTERQRQLWLSLICVERRTRIQRMRPRSGKDHALVAGVVLELALRLAVCERSDEIASWLLRLGEMKEAFDVPDFMKMPLQFSFGDDGKPYIDGEQKILFNLSHSSSYVMLALGQTEVGVDIEKVRRKSDCRKIAERCFHEREQAYLADFWDSGYAGEFTKVWTAKEAFVKYTGEGLRRALNSFVVVLETESVKTSDTLDGCVQRGLIEGEPVVLYVWDFVENYRLTACCEAGETIAIEMIGG